MSFTYRMATAEDRNAYIDFINYVFSQAHQPHDFKRLIPKEYGDGRNSRAEHFLALDEKGGIRGCVAVLPYELSVLGRELKLGFIGSVSVHPYARGENHMKTLMAMAEEWMMANGIDLGVLGGLRQRYQYFGYSKGGVSTGFAFTATNVRHALRDVDCAGVSIEPVTAEDDARLDAIFALHNARPIHALRSRERFLDIAHTWTNNLHAVMIDGECKGYLIAGNSGNVAECQLADAADYPRVFKQWMTVCGANHITVSALTADLDLIDFMDRTAENTQINENENYRIFNWEKVLEALLALKQQVIGISDGCCCLKVSGQPLCIRCEGGNIAISREIPEDAPEFTALQLQDAMLRPAALMRPVAVGGAPRDWFPLPLSLPTPDGF